ncbi:hypothetical protein BZG36_00996 [Bifiguratus adelaidae]|uniref:Bacterial transcription activator effector binding domain-containing protein n=1 Tax=Bifiguratus adelaidae TaxID=1938954 RepID=A0A261Y6D6_9FUNG|nr:hypothetical protein BZG36_00996 [Bifiguratus adelaidae]
MSYSVVEAPERHILVNEVLVKNYDVWFSHHKASYAYLQNFAKEADIPIKSEMRVYPEDPTKLPFRFWHAYSLPDDMDINSVESKIAAAGLKPSNEEGKGQLKTATLRKTRCAHLVHDDDGNGRIKAGWDKLFGALEASNEWTPDTRNYGYTICNPSNADHRYEFYLPVIAKND